MTPMDDRLIYLISKAQQCLFAYLKREFDAERLTITPGQTGILFLLKKNDFTMTELSRTLSVDNSAITGLVDRLEKSGLVTRLLSPDDRRAYRIHLTDPGLDQINRAQKIIKRVNEEIKADFSMEEVDAFKKVLNRFFTKFK